jgi:hypothetical protein
LLSLLAAEILLVAQGIFNQRQMEKIIRVPARRLTFVSLLDVTAVKAKTSIADKLCRYRYDLELQYLDVCGVGTPA